MELEETVKQHDKAIARHDREISRLNDNMQIMQQSLNEGLARVDESNKFLREQNTYQSEQNNKILNAVLSRNEKHDEHSYDLKMLNRTNMWKIIGITVGSGGVVSAIVALVAQLLGG